MANGPGDPATSQTLHSSTPEQATRSREVYFAKAALRRRSAFRFAFQSAQRLAVCIARWNDSSEIAPEPSVGNSQSG